jgi:hypothetical protein
MPNEEMGSRALPQPPGVENRVILMVVGGFLAFVAAAIFGIMLFLKTEAPGAFAPRRERPFPGPALQKLPQNDLANFEAAQRSTLSGYGWVDPGHGAVRIPIEQAMQMIAARGEHAYDPLQAPPTSPPEARGGGQ